MVQIDIEYLGGLRTQATHVPSGQTLLTDAPVDNGGKGETFSPTDLVATALGSCMLTIMGLVAERRGLDVSGAKARVVKNMAAAPARKIGQLEVVVSVPNDLDAESREVLERSAAACPVHATLGSQVDIPVRFEWGAPVA